jgi:hypothetical protein
MRAELRERNYELFSCPPQCEHQPVVFGSTATDPDAMYYHQAMKQPDRAEFIKAMEDEVRSRTEAKQWRIVARSSIPKGTHILPAVWAMRRKRRIDTREVYKWKARLVIDGSKQTKGLNFWETYSPVASWATVRLVLILAIKGGWHTKQIDYVLAYTQADSETDLYMKIPSGFEIDGSTDEFVLKMDKNPYGARQAGRVWNKHLVERLTAAGFSQSSVDECVFYKGTCIYVLYTDDSILVGPDLDEIERTIQAMKDTGLELTVEGDLGDFLGVKINRRPDGTTEFTQPHLIDQILQDLRIANANVTTKDTPALSSKILHRHSESEKFDRSFDYRSIIGKLNYLEKCSRPDIAYAVHQCARFSADPRVEHGKAVRHLGRYLAGTRDKGLIYRPGDGTYDCYVDADFAGNWDPTDAETDSATARSRTGFVIMYAECPIIWASKMQTEVALSTTEAEYIALSQALRDCIPLIDLSKEIQARGYEIGTVVPKVHCRVFEDNSGALELVKVPKMRPRTKHINVKYHHFRSRVQNGDISVHPIDTEEQPADYLTKPLPAPILIKHRHQIQGW